MSRRLLLDMLELANTEDIGKQFLTDLTYHIQTTYKDSPVSTFFSPSSLKCNRGAVLKALGCSADKEKRSVNSIGITSAGSHIHEQTQKYLTTMKDWEYLDVSKHIGKDLTVLQPCNFEQGIYETKLESKKWNIHFMLDGLLKYKNNKYILEIKSMSGGKFYKMKDISEYKVQVISYSVLLGIQDVILLAVDRDLYNMKCFHYRVSRQEKQEWINTMKNNLAYVERKLVPEKPLDLPRNVCAYCNFSSKCDELGEGECYWESS